MNTAAVFWLDRSANLVDAALAVAGTSWYLAIYTARLKRRSTQTIVSVVPQVASSARGVAAATGTADATAHARGRDLHVDRAALSGPFATLLRRDYRRAGVPMLPAVVVSLGPVLWDGAGAPYTVCAAGLGGVFVRRAEAFRLDADTPAAGRLFRDSIVCLAGLFVTLVADRMLAR